MNENTAVLIRKIKEMQSKVKQHRKNAGLGNYSYHIRIFTVSRILVFKTTRYEASKSDIKNGRVTVFGGAGVWHRKIRLKTHRWQFKMSSEFIDIQSFSHVGIVNPAL